MMCYRRRVRLNVLRMVFMVMKIVLFGVEECFIKGVLMVGGIVVVGYVGILKLWVKEVVILGLLLVLLVFFVVLVGVFDEDFLVVLVVFFVVFDLVFLVVVDCFFFFEVELVV